MSHLGKRLSALVDGELDGAQRERVLAHLVRCEPCRVEAATLRMLKQRMRSLGDASVGDALTGRLIALAAHGGQAGRGGWPRFADRARPDRPRRGRKRPARAMAAVAAALVIGAGVPVAGFLLGGSPDAPGPRVTPSVDVFIVQHAITTGEAPAQPGASFPSAIPPSTPAGGIHR